LLPAGVKISRAEPFGAEFAGAPSARRNLIRPLTNRISVAVHAWLCQYFVSVFAITNSTEVTPLSASLDAFAIQSPTSRPYGGLHHTTPAHGTARPSRLSSSVWFGPYQFGSKAESSRAAASQVKPNSSWSRANSSGGVRQHWFALEKKMDRSVILSPLRIAIPTGSLCASRLAGVRSPARYATREGGALET